MKIGFIGFGNMASAMADGWVASGAVPAGDLYACANRFDALLERTSPRGMHACESTSELIASVDLVVVAVKPYMIEQVMAPCASVLNEKPFISVAAGWSNEDFERILPGTHHLSTCPNTPVAICEGVIACERVNTLTDEEHKAALDLLAPLGTVVEVESHLLSVAGTMGGCTPAFFAMVIEALADAAVKYGIPRPTAYAMVSQAMAGTAKLQLSSGQHPGSMKDAVCSPGGTTIKGVSALERAGMRSAFIQAIDAIEGC